MKDTVRTFIAVKTGAAVKQAAAGLIESFAAKGAKVSWVRPQNMHLTLKFLDEVRWNTMAELTKAVQQAAASIEPFELEIRGAGAFPTVNRPRTIWLGAGEGSEAIVALHAALEAALTPLGFAKDVHRYAAHLTLGRIRDEGAAARKLSPLIAQHEKFSAGRFLVRELVVFSSELTPQGPIYDEIGHGTLGTP